MDRNKIFTKWVVASLGTDVIHHDNAENFPIKVLFKCVNHMGLLQEKSSAIVTYNVLNHVKTGCIQLVYIRWVQLFI